MIVKDKAFTPSAPQAPLKNKIQQITPTPHHDTMGIATASRKIALGEFVVFCILCWPITLMVISAAKQVPARVSNETLQRDAQKAVQHIVVHSIT